MSDDVLQGIRIPGRSRPRRMGETAPSNAGSSPPGTPPPVHPGTSPGVLEQQSPGELRALIAQLAESHQALEDRCASLQEEVEALRTELAAARTQQLRLTRIPLAKLKQVDREHALHKGERSYVFKALYGGSLVALKEPRDRKTSLLKGPMLVAANRKLDVRFKRELKRFATIRHPHIVQFLGAVSDPSNPTYSGVVLEFCAGGSLQAFLDLPNARLTPLRITSICLQVVTALDFLHSFDPPIAHRALHPGNILLSVPLSSVAVHDPVLVKLCDFAVSKDLGAETAVNSTLSEHAWTAPEQLDAGEHLLLFTPIDIYQLGLCLYWMLSSTAPFKNETMMRLVRGLAIPDGDKAQLRPNVELCRRETGAAAEAQEELIRLMQQCWLAAPARRPTARFLLRAFNHVEVSALRSVCVIPPQLDFSPSFIHNKQWELASGGAFSTFLLRDAGCDFDAAEMARLELLMSAHLQWNAQKWKITRALATFSRDLTSRFLAEHALMQRQHNAENARYHSTDYARLVREGGRAVDENDKATRLWIRSRFEQYVASFGHPTGVTTAPVLGVRGVSSEARAMRACEVGLVEGGGEADEGYFGKGIYLTTHLDYALNYTKERVVVIAWALAGNTYPATESPMPPQMALMQKKQTLYGQPLRRGYQSHYTVVRREGWAHNNVWVPCTKQEASTFQPVYDELVVPESARALPRYVVWLKEA